MNLGKVCHKLLVEAPDQLTGGPAALGVIAQRFGVSSAALAEFNGIDYPNKILAGQSLTIPPADFVPASTTTAAAAEG